MVRKAIQPVGAAEPAAQRVDDIGEHQGPGAGHRRATSPGSARGSTSADTTVPTCALLPRRTTEITAMLRLTETPLVVIELPAQRKVASTLSVTSTMVSSAPPSLAASSKTMLTTCCAVITCAAPQHRFVPRKRAVPPLHR